MTTLQSEIFKEFGLNLELKPFGENQARNNVFVGETQKESFIIKLESINQLHQVKLSIEVTSHLLRSELLSSSRYVATKSGNLFHIFQNKIITVQYKEPLVKLAITTSADLINFGQALGEFHILLSDFATEYLQESNFYTDFMNGDIPLAQTPARRAEIDLFYKKHTPNYTRLTQGVVHNDLNLNNIFYMGEKFFFIDFEFLKKSPLISDLGVIALEFWEYEKGIQNYIDNLKYMFEGYENKIKLSTYDKDNIIVFSLRYLFSDENWYNYWSFHGNPDAQKRIPEIRKKQKLMLQVVK